MAQVSMNGGEYTSLILAQDKLNELVSFIKSEQKVHFTPENVGTYGAGEFARKTNYPDWLTDLLVKDMVDQFLAMEADEFTLWALTDLHYYSPKGREFNSYKRDDNVDILSYSEELNTCWYRAKEIKAEQDDRAAQEAEDGE